MAIYNQYQCSLYLLIKSEQQNVLRWRAVSNFLAISCFRIGWNWTLLLAPFWSSRHWVSWKLGRKKKKSTVASILRILSLIVLIHGNQEWKMEIPFWLHLFANRMWLSRNMQAKNKFLVSCVKVLLTIIYYYYYYLLAPCCKSNLRSATLVLWEDK